MKGGKGIGEMMRNEKLWRLGKEMIMKIEGKGKMEGIEKVKVMIEKKKDDERIGGIEKEVKKEMRKGKMKIKDLEKRLIIEGLGEEILLKGDEGRRRKRSRRKVMVMIEDGRKKEKIDMIGEKNDIKGRCIEIIRSGWRIEERKKIGMIIIDEIGKMSWKLWIGIWRIKEMERNGDKDLIELKIESEGNESVDILRRERDKDDIIENDEWGERIGRGFGI